MFEVKLINTNGMNAYLVLIHCYYCYVNIHSVENVNFVDKKTLFTIVCGRCRNNAVLLSPGQGSDTGDC